MAEYQMVVGGFLNNPLTGRRPIETPETEINRENVLKVVMGQGRAYSSVEQERDSLSAQLLLG